MTREILVIADEGTFKIEVPDDAKITYGYFNPGSREPNAVRYEANDGQQRKACLRIYKGKQSDGKQLAAFNGVRSFRDTSLKVTRMVAKVKGEEEYWQDDDGNFERKSKHAVEMQQLPDRF